MREKHKIKIGISSCLLGNNVRYDGGHKLDHYLRDTLRQFVQWVPVCPEVESGMPVPREPMQLVRHSAKPRLITLETKKDQTSVLLRWTGKKLKRLEQERICGFILKARSPSCGVQDTNLYSLSGKLIVKRSGLFAEAICSRFPSLPVEDEERLHDPGIRENFIERVFVYCRWMDLMKKGNAISKLVAFHAEHKYLIMAHSSKHLRNLGSLVANAKNYKRAELFERYLKTLMDGLKLAATRKKHANVLQHMAGYFKKQLSTDEKQELSELVEQYREGLVPLIVPITLVKHYVKKYDEPYLKDQHYLGPHPLEVMLRNHVRKRATSVAKLTFMLE